MIITLSETISDKQKDCILSRLRAEGYSCREFAPSHNLSILAQGNPGQGTAFLNELSGIKEIIPDKTPFRLVGRDSSAGSTQVRVGQVMIGGERITVMAGPCAIESREQAFAIAREVKRYGAVLFRGGAFKPRSSPYSFQGMGEEGLKILADVREETGMPVVSEITSPSQAELMVKYVDMLQVGARNMQNFELLKCVGRLHLPVLLKRGLSATIEEWLMSAEYILSEGNEDVVLCERGIRTFEPYTRNTLDLSAIPIVKRLSHLPVIIDPSHATGIREKVAPMARAAVAAGADGLMIEVHHQPEKALSDGPQSLFPHQFGQVMRDLYVIAPVIGKQVDFNYLEKAHKMQSGAQSRKDGRACAAYLGEPGSESHKACVQFFGRDVRLQPVRVSRELFEAVRHGEVDQAIVPLQNALTGSVHENYDLLLEYEASIVGEITLRIVHNLAASPQTAPTDIKRVFSHPTVFQQCRQYLDRHPEWQLIATQDAAGAAKKIAEEKQMGDAAITSPEATELYGLKTLEQSIETSPRNYTRFVVIAKEPIKAENAKKSSLIYATSNQPGALYETLRVFVEHNVNLVKLESRPVDGKPWESMFYVDLETDVTCPEQQKMIAELREYTDFLKILGVY